MRPHERGGGEHGAWQMLWTEEAVEVLKRLALEGRSASVIAAALGAASRNAVIGKASRIGIRLNGDGRASAHGGRPRARIDCRRRPCPVPSLLQSREARPGRSRVIPGRCRGEKGGMGLRRGRGWRNATGKVRGHPPIGVQMAARRSEKRRFRLLRAHAGRGPLLLRWPLPDGLSPADGETEPARAAVAPDARESVGVALEAASRMRPRCPDQPRFQGFPHFGPFATQLACSASK